MSIILLLKIMVHGIDEGWLIYIRAWVGGQMVGIIL